MNELIALLETIHPLTDALKKHLQEHLIPLVFPSRHILLEAPRVASHIYYLEEGFAMSYTYSDDGKITESFFKPGQLVLSFESFVNQKPSFEFIQLLKPSKVICISYETMLEVLTNYPESNEIYRSLMNEHYVKLQKQIRAMKRADHKSEYLKLRDLYPDIEKIVTQRAIASYLGITPQALARIKRNMS